MSDPVVSQAQSLGFICQFTDRGVWQISSSYFGETWVLSQTEERWLLSIGDVPQIYLSSLDAIAFLQHRYSFSQNRNRPE